MDVSISSCSNDLNAKAPNNNVDFKDSVCSDSFNSSRPISAPHSQRTMIPDDNHKNKSKIFQQPMFSLFSSSKKKNDQNRIYEEQINELRLQIQDRDDIIEKLGSELAKLNKQIVTVTRELDKCNSVMTSRHQYSGTICNESIDSNTISNKHRSIRLTGISAEPQTKQTTNIFVRKHAKSNKSETLIKSALLSNEFLKNLSQTHIDEIVECMCPGEFDADDIVINEGEPGSNLYIVEEGKLLVSKGSDTIGEIKEGNVFGELAILYNCVRTATVKAVTKVHLWALDRQSFQGIMMRNSILRQAENLDFLHNIQLFKEVPETTLVRIADLMEEISFVENEYIIHQGEQGNTFYIIIEGYVDVIRHTNTESKPQYVRRLFKGSYFGEKALLGEEFRTASVLTGPDGCKCLMIDRSAFSMFIENFSSLKRDIYESDDRNTTFQENNKFNVTNSSWSSTQQSSSSTYQTCNGSYCSQPTPRSSNLISTVSTKYINNSKPSSSPNVITLPSLCQSPNMNTHYPVSFSTLSNEEQFFYKIRLEDLVIITTLGVGGFGRVELVHMVNDKNRVFALKQMKKKHIVDTRQQEHISSERKIMLECHSPFIVRVYRSFKDRKYLYLLMELCIGGEVWTLLRERNSFDENTARFYIACAMEALFYLHNRGIVYRDLKPENLLLNEHGYCKIVDFGFAKKIGYGKKTWTFCGTPEYIAPEIILNKGHDFAADFWSLGILLFELLTGSPPFSGSDPMKTYNIILKGVESIEFPKKVSQKSTSIIKKLCRDNPNERLGYQKNGFKEVQRHKWFDNFNWDTLRSQTMTPPIIPKLQSMLDASNFDEFPKDDEIPPDDLTGWDKNF